MFRYRPISSHVFSMTRTPLRYGSNKGKGNKRDNISKDRLRILTPGEVVSLKSYDKKKDRLWIRDQRITSFKSPRVNIKHPSNKFSSYPKYSQMLQKVDGMTDTTVAELERFHRNANEAGLSGQYLNEHSKEVPSKEEYQMQWFKAQNREIDEHWFTRWSFGITPYQRLQLRIKDRVENLRNLKRLNLPRSQPVFVDGIGMQQFHSTETTNYLRFMRKKQLKEEASQQHVKPKYTNEDYTPLPNIKHEHVENDEDELFGLTDITNMDLSKIEIAKEEIKRMYYWENRVSKRFLNKVRNRLRKETKTIMQIKKEGARNYMLKRGLVDLMEDPNFSDDVINYKREKLEKDEQSNDNLVSTASKEERNLHSLLEKAGSDEGMKTMLQWEKKPRSLKKKKSKKSRTRRKSSSELIQERIDAAVKKTIKNPHDDYYTRSELEQLVNGVLRKGMVITNSDANRVALEFYPEAERAKFTRREKRFGVIPFPLKKIEGTTKRHELRKVIKQLNKALTQMTWDGRNTPSWMVRSQRQARKKRLNDIYALNTKANDERAAFNENIWVSDVSKVPDEFSPDDFGLLYPIPLSDYKKVLGPNVHKTRLGRQFKQSTSRKLCLMVREPIMDIVPEADRVLFNQFTETKRRHRGFLFAGGEGHGRTCMLLQSIHHCFRKGFLIFHIPNGQYWTKGKHYIEPNSILPGYFDAPEPTFAFLKKFFNSNKHVLPRIPLTQSYGLGDGSMEMETLYDLVAHAIERGIDEVGVYFKLILDELSQNKTVPMLFAIDEYNHFNGTTEFKYGNLLQFTKVEPQPVHSRQFVLHRALNRMLLDNDANKLFVCANTSINKRSGNVDYDKMVLTPIDVPRYNEKEMRTMVNYYCVNHFIKRPSEEYMHGIRFMSGGIARDLFKEVSEESY